MPTVAGKKYSHTKSGKAQAARARKRIMSDAMSRAKQRKTGGSMNRNQKALMPQAVKKRGPGTAPATSTTLQTFWRSRLDHRRG